MPTHCCVTPNSTAEPLPGMLRLSLLLRFQIRPRKGKPRISVGPVAVIALASSGEAGRWEYKADARSVASRELAAYRQLPTIQSLRSGKLQLLEHLGGALLESVLVNVMEARRVRFGRSPKEAFKTICQMEFTSLRKVP